MKRILNMGIDIGSTTVKIICLDDDLNLLLETYQRHYSDTLNTLKNILQSVYNNFSEYDFRISFTGSGALGLSKYLEMPFVQEVIACKKAIMSSNKKVDVAIELGGEDAKILYFYDGIEQRMNGSCAGGTGAFLDQMATLLNTDTKGLNDLALKGKNIYPIASRCGVFAKTDVQPLINEGASKEDIALSIMQAVVNQTIGGLACGKPIKGNVMFLGGPLNYLDSLRMCFIKTLKLRDEEVIFPDNAHLFVAYGSSLANKKGKVLNSKCLTEIILKLNSYTEVSENSLPPLFNSIKEYKKFINDHNKHNVFEKDIKNYSGNAYLGIDAGSTTAKIVLIDEDGNILYKDYKSNVGTPIDTIKGMLLNLYHIKPETVNIKCSGSTGYGEQLIKNVFELDCSEVETIAHYNAASFFEPNVSSIIDIGGQDMKYISIKDNSVDAIMLNEACSSGCGSFIETLAKSLNVTLDEFVDLAVKSKNPVDLGSRCTVFMNSKIKQTQKEGRPLGDIFAGLSYSVIKNALQKVMKIYDYDLLGDHIMLQGGTFLNNAVLRAFELVTGKNCIRSNISGLMGAYGMALISKQYAIKHQLSSSTVLNLKQINDLSLKVIHTRCRGCTNNCNLTVNLFRDKKFITGNRCEKGAGITQSHKDLPNMYKYKYERLFNYKSLGECERGKIGIPRVLNMYDDYPFWFTFFNTLHFDVVLSDDSNRELYEKGMETIPSESVCYPAKLVHGHIMNLIEKGVKDIFYPAVIFDKKEFSNSDNSYNCPIVTSYSESVRLSMDVLNNDNINFYNPFVSFDSNKLVNIIYNYEPFKKYKFTKKELRVAVKSALVELQKYRDEIAQKGEEIIQYLDENNLKGIVLAGRPYHIDKEINHGIDKLINSLGFAVLSEDSICHLSSNNLKLRVVDQWTYHSRIYRAADVVSKNKNLEFINLNSFGCGLDAIVTDQAQEILRYNNKLYTTLKIDENSNLGAIKIRIRSLIASIYNRNNIDYKVYSFEKNSYNVKKMKKTNTILIPDMSPMHMPLLTEAMKSCGYNVVYLSEMNDKYLENGLKYVNNDACYPSLIVIGQLISALKSGKYDLDTTTVLITQTGGGCRATNYIGLIRKALKEANLESVSILSFNVSNLEKDQKFNITLSMLHRFVKAVVLSDLLMNLYYSTKPYEYNLGESDTVYSKHLSICKEIVSNDKISSYKKEIEKIIFDFNSIKCIEKNISKIGVVGEILIKYNYYGNNNLVNTIMDEGCEVVVPELMGFVKYCCYNSIVKKELLNDKKIKAFFAKKALDIIELYELPIRKQLANTKYRLPSDIYELSKNVEHVISKGNQTGEGWFLTAEMIEFIKSGVNNIVCVQPFACLPNHIVGKAAIKKVKEIYRDANIAAIDYDPGTSHSNQYNRLKLLITVAKENMEDSELTK